MKKKMRKLFLAVFKPILIYVEFVSFLIDFYCFMMHILSFFDHQIISTQSHFQFHDFYRRVKFLLPRDSFN